MPAARSRCRGRRSRRGAVPAGRWGGRGADAIAAALAELPDGGGRAGGAEAAAQGTLRGGGRPGQAAPRRRAAAGGRHARHPHHLQHERAQVRGGGLQPARRVRGPALRARAGACGRAGGARGGLAGRGGRTPRPRLPPCVQEPRVCSTAPSVPGSAGEPLQPRCPPDPSPGRAPCGGPSAGRERCTAAHQPMVPV